MKKLLVIVFCFVIALTSAIAMSINVFADVDPIVFDLTVENPVMGGTKGFLAQVWSGNNVGTSGYDADEKAWKLETTIAIYAVGSGGYEEFTFPETINYEVYKYCAVSYKTVNMASEQGEVKVGFHGDGGGQVGDHAIRAISEGKYTKVIFNTEESFKDIVNTKFIISMQTWDSCELAPGAQLFVKYIAFFATEEEAKAFELNGEPDELDEPEEESEPEDSRDCIVLSPAAADIGIGWEGTGATEEVKGVFVGYSTDLVEYDEETYSVKFIGGGTAGVPGKMNIRFWAINDGTYNVKFNDYPYMAVCFKTENAREDLGFQPGDEINSTCGQVNNFIKIIGMTPDDKTIDQATGKALTMICGDESYGVKDVVLYVQYIAFFKTKADAEAFDYYEWLGWPKKLAERPAIFPLTAETVVTLCDTGAFGETSLATNSSDETEKALKIVFTQEMEDWMSLYLKFGSRQEGIQIDKKSEYGLIGFYYKAYGFGEQTSLCLIADGVVVDEQKTNINTDEYIWVTWTQGHFSGEIVPSIYAAGNAVPAGAVLYLKAIGLFPDQAAFDACDFDWLDEVSEPETPEPEEPDPEPGSVEPIIFDLTVENPIMSAKNGFLKETWSGSWVRHSISCYDADEKAWKLENAKDSKGNVRGAYEEFKFPEAIDFKTYKYCAIVYKTNNWVTDAGEGFISINNTKAETIINNLIDSNESGEYINTVVAITDSEITSEIRVAMFQRSSTLKQGCQVFIKYIAFFANKEEAEAYKFDLRTEPEASEPEVSEPEVPDPEPGSIEPIIFDLTVENPAMVGMNYVLFRYGISEELVVGKSGYDFDEKAWKLETTKDISNYLSGGVERFEFPEAIDFKTYKYCAIVYKTNNLVTDDGEGFVCLSNNAGLMLIEKGYGGIAPNESGEYINTVVSTKKFGTTSEIRFMVLCTRGTIKKDCQVFIKYIAFFANKEEAEAYKFDLSTKPETSEPEVSEPETSKPETSKPEISQPEISESETSQPEVSEPDVYEPETSKPETSKPETSQPEVSEPEASEPEKIVYVIPESVEIVDDTGVFEAGTTVTIEKVESVDKYEKAAVVIADDSAKFVVFEISAVKDSAAVQPDGKLKVSFAIPEGFNTNNVKMFYISDTGDKVEIPITVDKGNGIVVAELEHFSTYILVSAEKQEVDIGNIAMIAGAILLCAAAATVVVFGRKRSK